MVYFGNTYIVPLKVGLTKCVYPEGRGNFYINKYRKSIGVYSIDMKMVIAIQLGPS